MIRISNMNCLAATLLVAFVVSGCQTSNNRWIAWKEQKPKPQFKGLENNEKVTYWPYKSDKTKPKMGELPGQLKSKLASKTDQNKRDTQLTDFIREGDQLRKNGQLEDARLVYTKALRLSPENPDVNHRLAVIADKQHQYSTADEYYQAALRVRPRDVNLLSDLGYSYSLRGNTQQAEQTLKLALDIDRTHKGAMANMGLLYAQQNRRSEAMAMFRSGGTEAEAQQYYARLFPQDRPGNGAAPDWANSPSGPAMAAVTPESTPDLSKLSFEQIQGEMARRAQDAKRRRAEADQREIAQARNFAAGDGSVQQVPMQMPPANQGFQQGISTGGAISVVGPQGTDNWANPGNSPAMEMSQRPAAANFSPGFNPQNQSQAAAAKSTGGFETFRGGAVQLQPGIQTGLPIEPQIQQSQFQQSQQKPVALGSNAQAANDAYNASQMATQLAMNAGPGSLFPIVPASANDGLGSVGQPSAYDSRMGGEFQQPPAYQNPQNWSGNPNAQSSAARNNSPQIEGLPSIGPATPTSNWSSPTAGSLNWQGNSSGSPTWSSDLPNSGAAGSGIDSGAGQLMRPQNSDQRVESFDTPGSNTNLSARPRTGTDGAKPYNGAWPNANALPARPNSNSPANGRGLDNQDTLTINPQSGGGATLPNQNNAAPASSNSSVPQWPYSPNR